MPGHLRQLRFSPARTNPDPTVPAGARIPQNIGLLADVGDYDVDSPVAIQVSEGGASTSPPALERGTGIDPGKAASHIPEHQRRLQIFEIR